MKKKSQFDDLQPIIDQLKKEGFEVPENYVNMTPPEIFTWAMERTRNAEETTNIAARMRQFAELQKSIAQQQGQLQEQAKNPVAAKLKMFNFKKAQLLADPSLEMTEKTEQTAPVDTVLNTFNANTQLIFRDGAEIKEWLDTMEQNEAIEQLTNISGEQPVVQEGGRVVDPIDVIKGGIERFYQGETDQERLRMAMEIFDILPNSAKQIEPDQEQNIVAPFQSKEAISFVNDINAKIKKLAEVSTKAQKSYNLKKSAQAKTIDNVIVWGPSEKRIDPFLRQPVSDWSVVERNKGFGLVVDDAWNIDWETIWRSSIMDKYSRAYRDKNGNWVGGYIQKRFEVDKWIPEYNNMQLKPGQLRKPRLPQFGNLEARIEAMRNGDGVNKPISISTGKEYTPGAIGDPTGEAFNWQKSQFNKIASIKKKVI